MWGLAGISAASASHVAFFCANFQGMFHTNKLVLTSTNAVGRVVRGLAGREVPPATRWAAVGTSTARALMEHGIVPDLVPPVAVSDALVEVFPEAVATGSAPGRGIEEGAVLFVRAERVRDVVVPGLTARGWRVDEAVAYRTAAGVVAPAAADDARAADAVAFTSSSTVERTVELLGVTGVPPVIASIGPVTSASVRAAGLEVTVEATEHTLDGLVAAVAAAVSGAVAGGGPSTSAPAEGGSPPT